ncbi:hypothetical protein [Victivallis sp. Marseille-Q1083]|uniref:hypothetical protein n=1 Tax=Victivallis sp. Marseille-Q1083 TaxID=2717288 RepID=UPI00158E1266|nr:hypothetical protein [Victivallis sp. Marseille-Q1083]
MKFLVMILLLFTVGCRALIREYEFDLIDNSAQGKSSQLYSSLEGFAQKYEIPKYEVQKGSGDNITYLWYGYGRGISLFYIPHKNEIILRFNDVDQPAEDSIFKDFQIRLHEMGIYSTIKFIVWREPWFQF